jgi:hypothetical protein
MGKITEENTRALAAEAALDGKIGDIQTALEAIITKTDTIIGGNE